LAPALTIFAPGSIVLVHDTLRDGFARIAPEVDVVFHPPTHSGLLAKQILDGAAADVFISAGWRYVLELHDAGLLPQPEVIAGNRLALLVRPDLALGIRGLPNLMRPGLRLLVPPAESDPLGQYIVEAFARAGLRKDLAAKRQRGEVSDRLGGLRERLAAGEVDAAIIYASMLAAFRAAGTAIPLAPSEDMHDRIVFGAGAIVRDGWPHQAAETFVNFLIGPAGQALFEQAGFLPRAHALELP
jgi:molybdate transport system substrate-binding protein